MSNDGKKAVILAVGANPAWQKVLQFGKLNYGSVNRAEELWNFASGKGINFCRAVRGWGRADCRLLQFAGGENGKLLLDDLAQEGLTVHTVETETPTRCCVTCLNRADGSMTELIEPSAGPGAAAEQEALQWLEQEALAVNGMALCGQLPNGMDVDFLLQCVRIAAKNRLPLLIDSWQRIETILPEAERATLKINGDELRALTGESEIAAGIRQLLERYALERVAVTNGGECAYLGSRNDLAMLTVPGLEKIVNPVGSGDTASAVLLSELVNGMEEDEAFALALAAASANCLSMKCGEFDVEIAKKLRCQVAIHHWNA